MTIEQQNELEKSFANIVDKTMQENLAKHVAPMVAKSVEEQVKALRLREATGETKISDEDKLKYVASVKAASGLRLKSNEALIVEQDSRGGYLVPVEVANEILRISASVGVTLSQATKWPMTSDELDIPSYRGSFLTGEYLGVDAAGSATGITFNSARLKAYQWQLAFVVGNDLLADASANLADWLMALAAEAKANMIDKQAFTGSGPFVGILNDPNVTTYNLGGSTTSGFTTFASFDMTCASDMVAQLEESLLPGAAFYFERTVWAKIRMAKDANDNLIFAQANADRLIQNMKGGGPKPAGMILDYPVYTVRHLPANSATAVSTKFCVFGNLSSFAYGERGDITVNQFDSGSFGGKEIALANQRALVLRQRHALVDALPASFVVGVTSAS